MKTLHLLTIILLTSIVSFAANDKVPSKARTTIQGVVIDKITGEALAGVRIEINQSENIVYTDLDGNFEIKNIKSDTYNIKTKLISYKPSNTKVKCKENINNIEIKIGNL